MLKITPIVNDKADARTQVSGLPNHSSVLCILMESSWAPRWMKFQRKNIQFYSVESLQSHTDTQLHEQKGSAEQEDALWKALLGLDSGRQGHSSGVWLSTRWQFLTVPSCLWSTESLGQVGLRWLGRTGSPLKLAHLGGTTESRSWAGWDGSTGERP